MAVIEPTVDKLNEPTVMLQIRNVAKAVDKNLNAVNDEMTDIQEQISQIEDSSARVDDLEDDMQTAQHAITEIQQKDTEQDTAISQNESAIEAETTARENADITGASLNVVSGAIQLLLNRTLENINTSVKAPFIKTMELIPTATERAFKIRVTFWDDTQYDTNDFVIPAGGGTDISVTGVTIQDGTSPNSFQVEIELSDGEPIASNDYPFPAGNKYPTGITGTVGIDGNITLSILMNEGNPITTSINMNYFASSHDLSDLQEQVTGIKPTVTTNLESSPPTITVQVNGTSSTANLPTSSATGTWEELDPSNLPTDFQNGDILLMTVSNGSGNMNNRNTLLFTVDEGKTNTFVDIAVPTSTSGTWAGELEFNRFRIKSPAELNNTNTSTVIMDVRTLYLNINGSFRDNTLINLTRANFSTYCTRIWRLRSQN